MISQTVMYPIYKKEVKLKCTNYPRAINSINRRLVISKHGNEHRALLVRLQERKIDD